MIPKQNRGGKGSRDLVGVHLDERLEFLFYKVFHNIFKLEIRVLSCPKQQKQSVHTLQIIHL